MLGSPSPVQHTPNKKITCNLADRLAILRTLLLRAPVTMLVLYNVDMQFTHIILRTVFGKHGFRVRNNNNNKNGIF